MTQASVSPARISVVVPCRNGAAYVGEALASIRAQTRAPLEVVVVDDASSDGSPAVVAAWSAAHPDGPPLRLLRHERPRGAAAARNTGIDEARGDVIAFLDADDRWAPEHLAVAVGLLDAHPEAVLAATHARAFGNADYPWRHQIGSEGPRNVFWAALADWIVLPSASAVRASALHETRGFREDAVGAEDYELVLRLAHRWPFVGAETESVGWRKHARQQSARPDVQRRALRRLQARFVAEMAGVAAPRDRARMCGVALRTWWRAMRDAHDPSARSALLAEGRQLAALPGPWGWRLRLWLLLGAAHLSHRAARLRAAYALARRTLVPGRVRH
jgi:hypothetical protein